MLRHTEPSSGITSTPRSSDIMQYTVRHLTRFTYDNPISESVMEVRMQPRTEQHQRCLGFELTTTPRATVTAYRDPLSNIVHHFDIPGRHGQLTIVAEAIVEFVGAPNLPASLPVEAWTQVEAIERSQSHWEFLQTSPFTRETPLLKAFDATLATGDRRDPLSEMLAICEAIHRRFTYRQQVTGVDSPIDHALESGEGVCQDFAHVMLACVRRRGIPARYVSGYLFHGSGDTSADGATHAWIEAFLPGLGWVGFDPTNNVDRRHAPHPRRDRPRLRRRAADQGRLPRPLGQRAGGRRPGVAGRHGRAHARADAGDDVDDARERRPA